VDAGAGPHPQPLSQCAGRREPDLESRCYWQLTTTSASPPLLTAVGEGGRGVRDLVGAGDAYVCKLPPHDHLRLPFREALIDLGNVGDGTRAEGAQAERGDQVGVAAGGDRRNVAV
jgi:hypothetical protein